MPSLPSYLEAAKPVPMSNRLPWYKTITPAYLGVMLWFVFWQVIVTAGSDHPAPGGVLAYGFLDALLGLIAAALICHFLFYLVPGLLGMKTGLPLYVVGSSTYGARGGLYMPGLLMGVLQFGWLGVNAWAVAGVLCKCFGRGLADSGKVIQPGWWHGTIASVFIVLAAFVGLKGIRYVGRVGTYLNLIPVVVLIVLLTKTAGGLFPTFPTDKILQAAPITAEIPPELIAAAHAGIENAAPESDTAKLLRVVQLLCVYVVGFFATAGAAGVDIAMSSRSKEDVHIGGIFGILLPTVLAGGVAMLVVAGAYGKGMVFGANVEPGSLNPVELMHGILKEDWANAFLVALAISSFPGACFSSFIAANSFKTTMPRINPFITVGCGALVSIALAVSGWAGDVASIFALIGASFGPICGAMVADYLLAGRKWSGPRAGFNPAGWISWFVGFVVGGFNLGVELMLKWNWLMDKYPGWRDHLTPWRDFIYMPPVAAFVVGFGLYLLLSVLGARTRKLEMPGITS